MSVSSGPQIIVMEIKLFFVIFQLSEYIRAHDYMNGFIVIVDISEVKIVDILPKINLMYLRQALSIYIVSIY